MWSENQKIEHKHKGKGGPKDNFKFGSIESIGIYDYNSHQIFSNI
jgi:hypothetical protein